LVNEASKNVVTIREQGNYYSWDSRVYGPGEQLKSTDLTNGKWKFTDMEQRSNEWDVESLVDGTFALKNANGYLAYDKPGLLAFKTDVTAAPAATTFRAVSCTQFVLPSKCMRLQNSKGNTVSCESKNVVGEEEPNSDKSKLETHLFDEAAAKKTKYGGHTYWIKCLALNTYWGVSGGNKLVASAGEAKEWEIFHPGFDAAAGTVSFFSDQDYTWVRRGDNGFLNTKQKRKDDKGIWHGPETEGTFTVSKCVK